MKKQMWLTSITIPALFAFASTVAFAGIHYAEDADHTVWKPNDIEWGEGPASLEEGAQMAILEGDPGEPGIFTIRLQFPSGFQIQPHTHPKVERVTVLEGDFKLGMGREFDEEAMDTLNEGSFFRMPPGMAHFAETDGGVTFQLTGEGPWEIHYINPADDPRESPPAYGERPEQEE